MTKDKLEYLFKVHTAALSAHYGNNLKAMKFSDAELYESDSVISKSVSKKEAFISRHYITGHHLGNAPTHVLILKDNCFDRA
jgi:hypothetical protein